MAASQEFYKSKRATIKGKLTRIANFLKSFDEKSNTFAEIKARQTELEKIFTSFDEVQSAIEEFDYELAEKRAAHEKDREEFEAKYFSTTSQMEALLTKDSIRTSDNEKPRVKLPQLEIPRFGGDLQQCRQSTRATYQ
ncbi:unnamed protein product, partial [Iphiclides podalirius]